MTTLMPAKKDTVDFEQQLAELEQLVGLLEEGNLPLEQSLSLFEQGIKLSKNCYTTLNAAEQKVKVLIEKNGLSTLEDFNSETENGNTI
jgi:exodeoxyribonuclease VII small subunit